MTKFRRAIDYMRRDVFTAPLLFLAIMLLTDVSSGALANRSFESEDAVFLFFTLLQLLIYLLTGIIYIKCKPKNYLKELHLVSFGFSQLPITLLMLPILILTGVLYSAFLPGDTAVEENTFKLALFLTDGNYLSDVSTILRVTLALAAIPAICEEFIFRGILTKEYSRYGFLPSLLLTSLLFALLHGGGTLFPFYFLSGIILGFTAYVTRSVLASTVLHLLYNLFVLFGQPFLTGFFNTAASSMTLLAVLIVLYIFLLGAAAGEAARLFSGYAATGIVAPSSTEKSEEGVRVLPRFLQIFSPTFFIMVLFVILNLLGVLQAS